MAERSGPVTLPDPVRRALDWLGDQEKHYSPAGTFSAQAEKSAVELALMVGSLTRPGAAPVDPADPAVGRLVDLIQAIGERPDVRCRPIVGTADVLLHAVICGVLEWSGRPAGHYRTVVRHAVTAGVIDSADRLPYHMLEERMLLDWIGIAAELPDLPEIAARSMLSRRLRAVQLTERTAYQLTHDIMFLGALDPGSPVPVGAVDVRNLSRVLADLVVSFAAESHWDLVGELLLSWDCLHLPQGPLYHRAWDLLLSRQAADGSFPGPPPPRGADPDPDGGAARFRHRHHTTLVAVLALHGRARLPANAGAGGFPRRRPGRSRATAANLATAVRKDAQWLRGLLDRPGAAAPAAACGVLVGTWLCAAVDSEIEATMPAVARRVAGLLQEEVRFETAPPALTLTAYALLRRSGDVVPGLAEFVELASRVLANDPPVSAGADLALCEKRVLLHRLGITGPPQLLAPERTRSIIDETALRPTPEALATAVLAAESSTAHGTVRGGDDPSATILERHAVHQFRSRNLATGCNIARAAHHLGPVPADRADEFADRILLHQLPAGGYGRRLGVGDELPGVDPHLQLHLPTTLACLWTLAELSGDFRLYRSVGPTVPAATTVR